MTSNKSKTHLLPAGQRSLAKRAAAILAVDDIKVSDSARELLSQCEAGTLTFAEAREEIIARARSMAGTKSNKQD